MVKPIDIVGMRLKNQLLSLPSNGTPEEVVGHLVAIQAQDYFGALWAVGLRLHEADEQTVEQAFNVGRIIRTHVMRPTWHFVAAEDIRWLLMLTAPRVHAQNAYMYRQNGLDAKTLVRAHAVIEKALAGATLTRDELRRDLEKAKIKTSNLGSTYIVMHAELEGLICSGPRKGKQFTYALLDERVPTSSQPLDREECLAQFMLRFFTARGPATARDFSYWSGLTVADVKAGIEMVKSKLTSHEINGSQYWYGKNIEAPKGKKPVAYLLPNYDEFGMSYKDHGVSLSQDQKTQMLDYSFSHLIVINGQLIGSWRRGKQKDGIEVELWPFKPLKPAERKLIEKAAERYQAFLQRSVRLLN